MQSEQRNPEEKEIIIDNLYSRVMHASGEEEINREEQEPTKEEPYEEDIDDSERIVIFKEEIPTLLSNLKLIRNPRKVIKGALILGSAFFLGMAALKISSMIEEYIESLTEQEPEDYIFYNNNYKKLSSTSRGYAITISGRCQLYPARNKMGK